MMSSPINPAIRSWVDDCLVPILVREYLAEMERGKSTCSEVQPVAKFAATRTAIAEEGR